MPRRGQGVAAKARKPGKPSQYKPNGAVPYPLLSEGTMYRPGMAVAQTITQDDMEWERTGHVCWVTWRPEVHAWEATVDWGGIQEQQGKRPPGSVVWLLDLSPA